MKAYQMIYTACGKDKSGAFSVWAKSNNVSKKECDEIVKLMNYKKPKNAPYEPTEKEIEELFPQKYAYFELSSGRKCIAKTSYIGKVYSDIDNRNGNFIIHAYVFDSLDGFNPYYIFNSNIFKNKLSYKEWHDDPLVEDLPAVDLQPLATPSEADVRKTVEDYGDAFSALLEAVLRCADGENTVLFNDTEINQAKLYLALGALLPLSVLEKATFSTQYSIQAEYSLKSIGAIPVKIRNIYEYNVVATFNYQQEIALGKYGFDFVKSVFCNVDKFRRYCVDVISDLGNVRYFDLLKKIALINDIMKRANCNIDTANAIYNIRNENYSWFTDLNEFSTSLSLATSMGLINLQNIASNVFENVVKKGKWGIDLQVASLIQNLYGVSDATLKAEVVSWFYDNLDNFVQTNQDIHSFIPNVKNVMPFPWNDFRNAFLVNKNARNIILAESNFNKICLLYSAYVDAIVNNIGDEQIVCNNIVDIAKKVAQSRDVVKIRILLEQSKILGGDFESWLVDNAWNSTFTSVAVDKDTLNYGFEFINSFTDERVQAQCLKTFILSNINSPLIIPVYIEQYEKNQGLYEHLEKSLSLNANLKMFLLKKDAFVFDNKEKMTGQALQDYFNKFYVTGYDNGAYLNKIKQYLEGLPNKEKYAECIKLYYQTRQLNDGFCDVIQIVKNLEHYIYTIPLEELLVLANGELTVLSEIDARLKHNAKGTSFNFELLRVLSTMTSKSSVRELENLVQYGQIYQNLSALQINTLTQDYSKTIINAYISFKKHSRQSVQTILFSFFEIPFSMVKDAGKNFIESAKEINDKSYYEFMTDLFGYAFNQKDDFSNQLRGIIINSVNNMKRGEYKKLFKKVNEMSDKRLLGGVNNFIDDYLDKHKGFFEQLFGSKNDKGQRR